MISAGLSIREYGGYVFVNLHGELDVSDAASVADALTAVAFRNPRIIVDLAALVFIDCCAPCRGPAATVSSARCPGHPRHPHRRNQRAGRRHPGRAAALSGSGRARTRPDHAMQLTRKD